VRSPALLSLVFASFLSACGDDDPVATHPRFAVDLPVDPAAPIPIAGIPYPNDLLLGPSGTLNITEETIAFGGGADENTRAMMVMALSRARGFGVTTGAIFPVADLPEGDRVDADSVDAMLIRLGGSGGPVDVHVRNMDDDLYLSPRLGQVLSEGQSYAYVIRAARSVQGLTFAQDPDLARLLADDGPDAYAPLRGQLGRDRIDPASVLGATVFTTAVHHTAIEKAREALLAGTTPAVTVERVVPAGAELDDLLGTPVSTRPGWDNEGGVTHASIHSLVLGNYTSIDFLSAAPESLGRWELDAGGAPMAKGSETIHFLLALPVGRTDWADIPVVIFQHGLGGSRDAVLTVADRLCARGFAVVGIDIPFHGDRFPASVDNSYNVTSAPGPDGLADGAGLNPALFYFDILGDAAAGVLPFDPEVMASTLRQTVVDYMSLAWTLDEGSWAALDASYPGLSLDISRVVYVSESFGSITGAALIPFEPRVRAFIIDVGGGGLLSPLLENSPDYWPIFGLLAGGNFGLSQQDLDPTLDPPHVHREFIMLQSLLEPGDPLTYAGLATTGSDPAHVLLLAAFADEAVPNQASEALAAAMGLQWTSLAFSPASPRYVTGMPVATAPVAGNLYGDVTGALVLVDPATHGMLTRQRGERTFEPEFAPFIELPAPIPVDNPIEELQDLVGHFAESYRATGVPEVADPP
jgi:hypothetical protein